MRVFEIEFKAKPISYSGKLHRSLTKKNIASKKGIDLLGKGATAYAISKKSKPHEVKRISVDSQAPKFDPYYKFLKIAIANQDNTAFPKVYEVKVFRKGKAEYQTDRDRYIVYVEMEKLIPWQALSWGQWSQLMQTTFGKSIREFWADAAYPPSNKEDMADRYTGIVASYITKPVVMTRAYGPIQDMDLMRALLKLKGPLRSVALDLHSDNLMYRRTRYGVQPVIVDPYYYQESKEKIGWDDSIV